MKPSEIIVGIFYLLFILLSIGCKKEDNKYEEFSLKGQIFENCIGTPAANVTIELWQNFVKGERVLDQDIAANLISTTNTSINGNFEFKLKFNTLNSSNFPRSGSVRIKDGQTNLFLANGWMEIANGARELDLGVLYKNYFEKTLPFVFINDLNYEPDDKIMISKVNDLFSFDIISITGTSNQLIVNRMARFLTKTIIYDSVASQGKYESSTIVHWDFINRPDETINTTIYTNTCSSVDTVFLKWW